MGLKNVPAIISPKLLYILSTMGHGDEIVLADIHFPTSSICKCGPEEIRADGHRIPELLDAILKLFPLDTYVDQPAAVMDLVESDKAQGLEIPVWNDYLKILNKSEDKDISIEKVERFAFYDRAKKAFAVVHSGETSKYANIILKKGLVQYDTA